MPTYAVYGLRLDSALVIPELPETDGTPDAVLRLEPIGVEHPDSVQGDNWYRTTPDETCLVWSGFAAVRVSGGREIRVDLVPGAEESLLRAVLLGPVLSLLLRQRGLFPLHASALVMDGSAIALAANSGGGKSTLAALLHARGHGFLTDDLTAIRLDVEPPRIYPGFPWIKLSPEALDLLGVSPESLPRAHAGTDERLQPVDGHVRDAVPLSAIYVLEDGLKPEIARIPPQKAFFQVLRHCHQMERIGPALSPVGLMELCAGVARRVPVYRLRRPRSLDRLKDVAQRIEEHHQLPGAVLSTG